VPGSEAERLDDIALLRLTAGGDRDAFAIVVARHQASVFRLARVLTRDAAAAEDVLQQTFLSAWQAASQFRGDASARTWLLTIARHAAQRHGEKRAREPIDDTPIDELGLRAGWGGPSPEALAIAAQDRDRVAAAFAQLDADDRDILTLRDLEDVSGPDAAASLGISLAAMKSRLHRARLKLAAALNSPEAPHAAPRS
jgi:RNA polymerase sigma-70 factor (ECF subfamily)